MRPEIRMEIDGRFSILQGRTPTWETFQCINIFLFSASNTRDLKSCNILLISDNSRHMHMMCVVSHMWMSHVAIYMNHSTQMNVVKSCEILLSSDDSIHMQKNKKKVFRRHVTRVNESCRNAHESRHIKWVMSSFSNSCSSATTPGECMFCASCHTGE